MREKVQTTRELFRLPVFRSLFLATALSEVGDWAARFALGVLVYAESGSAALTGAVTVVSLATWLGPGQLLATVADRHSRRRVLVVCDLVRAAAFALVAVGLPLPLLLLVVLVAGLATPPAHAAASAVTPAVVPRELLPAASVVGGVAGDLSLVLGTLAGGSLVAAVGATGALWFNAATFAVSAWLVRVAPDRTGDVTEDSGSLRVAGRVLRETPLVRRAALLACTAMGSASAGIAMLTPYVLGDLGGPSSTVALLIAFASLVAVGVTAVAVPHHPDPVVQLRSVALLSLVGGAGLLLIAVEPTLPLLLLPLVGLGVLQVVLVPASALVAPLLPDDVRATAFSLLVGGLTVAQISGAAGAGLLAEVVGPAAATAVAAVPAVVGGALHLRRPVPANEAAEARVLVAA